MKKRVSILKIIFVILLAIGSLGGIFYLSKTVYDKYNPKDDETEMGYIIYFDANGGKLTDAETMLTNKDGTLDAFPNPPVRSGYVFTCWALDPEASESMESEIPGIHLAVTLNTVFYRNTEVYAIWLPFVEPNPTPEPDPAPDPEPKIHTITFDANGGELTGAATMYTMTNGKLWELPTDPVRIDYEFAGWSRSSTEFDKITTNTVFDEDTTVYAHWIEDEEDPEPEPEIYTITFDANGGALNDVETMDTNGAGKLPYMPIDPVRLEYVFLGWSLDPMTLNKISLNTVFTSNTTVYAYWTDAVVSETLRVPPKHYSSNEDIFCSWVGANGSLHPFNTYFFQYDDPSFSGIAFGFDNYSFLEKVLCADDAPAEWNDWYYRYIDTLCYTSFDSNDERLVAMAKLEAELLSFNILMPISLSGGNNVESKIDFNSGIATTEFISAELHEELAALYNELYGTGEYKEAAKLLLQDNGYELTNEITLAYTQDLSTWDIHNNPTESDLRILRNAYIQNMYNAAAPDEGYIFESFELADDGMSARLYVRDGIKWMNYQGTLVGTLVADDFVAGVQHALDCGNRAGIVGVIDRADEYINGYITDFDEVGIHALFADTLEISFIRPVTAEELVYLLNTYSGYTPLCLSLYASYGGWLGTEFEPTNSSYTYGMDNLHIAYLKCTCEVRNGTIKFEIYDGYYDRDHVDIKRITFVKRNAEDIPGDDMLSFRNLGTQSVAGNANAMQLGLGDTSLMLVFSGLAAEDDGDWDTKKQRTNDLLRLDTVRLLITRALLRMDTDDGRSGIIDRYLGTGGENSITNILSKPNSSTTEDEITIYLDDGTEITLPSGTLYEALVDIYACGHCTGDPTFGSALGFDGWHDDTLAEYYYGAAKQAVEAVGYVFDNETPLCITLGIVGDGEDDSYAAGVANAIKDALETFNIIVEIVYADASADISQFDIALCYCRTPQELQF